MYSIAYNSSFYKVENGPTSCKYPSRKIVPTEREREWTLIRDLKVTSWTTQAIWNFETANASSCSPWRLTITVAVATLCVDWVFVRETCGRNTEVQWLHHSALWRHAWFTDWKKTTASTKDAEDAVDLDDRVRKQNWRARWNSINVKCWLEWIYLLTDYLCNVGTMFIFLQSREHSLLYMLGYILFYCWASDCGKSV